MEERSVQTLTLSFSSNFGSAPIDYYLLRISDTTDITDTTTTTLLQGVALREDQSSAGGVKGEEELVEGGEVVGYGVKVRVTRLEQGVEYVFSVAGVSEVGVGNYSDRSEPFSLGIPTAHIQ